MRDLDLHLASDAPAASTPSAVTSLFGPIRSDRSGDKHMTPRQIELFNRALDVIANAYKGDFGGGRETTLLVSKGLGLKGVPAAEVAFIVTMLAELSTHLLHDIEEQRGSGFAEGFLRSARRGSAGEAVRRDTTRTGPESARSRRGGASEPPAPPSPPSRAGFELPPLDLP